MHACMYVCGTCCVVHECGYRVYLPIFTWSNLYCPQNEGPSLGAGAGYMYTLTGTTQVPGGTLHATCYMGTHMYACMYVCTTCMCTRVCEGQD